ncbi:tetratricopeptide repeat protein [Pseudoalteromonas spongiae]|uniref:tetratricopeptide repeat protein n=1 Tax=Pseudoalteromonas spongiae TaxID=298657 RepID=UPI0018E24C1E|nr:tetratricopeptide repeat protein [Pseudoalteromonas spongiae]
MLTEIDEIAKQADNIEVLNSLRQKSIDQNNIEAFANSTDYILKNYLKAGLFEQFDEEVTNLKLLHYWQTSPELRAITLANQANKAHRQGDTKKAIEIQASAIDIVESFKIISRFSEVYTRMGIYLRNDGEIDKAETSYNKALEFAKEQNDHEQIARITMNLGVVYEARHNFNKALELYKSVLPKIEKTNNRVLLADCLFNIANLYARLRNFEQALTFSMKVLELDKQAGDITNLIYSYNKVAEISHLLGHYTTALEHVNQSIALSDKSQNMQLLSSALMRKGYIYLKMGQLDEAFKFAEQSADITLKLDNVIHKNNSLPPLARLYISIEKYEEAIVLLNQISGEEISPSYMIKKHASLAKAYHGLGDYLQAYNHQIKVQEAMKEDHASTIKAYKDEMDTELAKFTEELKVKDLELENEKQQSDLEVMQYRQYFGITLALIVFLLLSLLIYSQIKKKQMAQAQARLKEAAIDHKNQMLSDICHELRTPFSVLKLQIEALQYNLEPDTELAHNRLNAKIEQLSHLVSDIDQLSQADSMVLTLNKVKVNAHNLLNAIITDNRVLIEKVGLELKLDIQLDETLDVDLDINRIQQVFHNLFSNAIRYTSVPGFIRLKARNDHNNLFIQIDDTAPGVSLEDIEHLFNRLYRVEKSRSRATGGLGLGLSICKSLIELHNGCIIAKQGKSGGLCIQITLPLH